MATYAGSYDRPLQDRFGNGYRNAKVAVQTLVGGAVTLYADRTKTAYVPASGLAANEIKADDKGNLKFFADPGNYQIVVTPSGGSALTAFPVSVLPDPLEPDASEGALQAEQEAREAADTALTQAIDDEGTTRGNADTALQGSIDTLTTGKQDKEPSRIYVSSTGNDANAGTMPGAPLATLTQAVTNAGSTQTTIIILNALSVAANVTLPTTVRLEFVGAGRLTPTSGMTVTISGTFAHPARQIFSTLSGGTIAFASTARVPEMYPEWWGAVGNGTTPDGTPLTASAVAAASIGVPLIVTKIHGLSNTLSLPSNADLRGKGGGGFRRINTSTASALIATTGTTGVKMRDFTADANSLMTGTVVLIQGATDFEVKRLQVSDPARNVGQCIQVAEASQDGVVERNTCDGCLVGIRVAGTSRHIKVVRNRTKNTKNRGIYVVAATSTEAPSDIDIAWNVCTDLDSSGTVRSFIQIVGHTSQYIERVRVAFNTVIGPGLAYGATPAGTADQITYNFVRGIQLIGNKSLLGGDVGISGANATDVVLALNESTGNNSAGLAQGGAGPTYNITVTGNTCRNNGQNQNNDREDWARVGIYLREAHNVVVGENVIVDDQVVKTQMYAGSYSLCSNVTLNPNAVTGLGVSNGWFDRGGNTGLKEVIPTAIP